MLLGGHDESQLTEVSYLVGVNLISSTKELKQQRQGVLLLLKSCVATWWS